MTSPARQLDLLKGPRQRGVRPPPADERRVHIAIADTLRIGLKPGWLAFHVPNGELRTEKTGALLKRLGVLPGVADFILIAPPAGRIHALELKRRGMRPTEAQFAFLARVEAAGGQTAWVDTFDAAIDQLGRWGAVRVKVSA